MARTIVIDNPSNLKLIPLEQLRPFQGDFKEEIDPGKLETLMRSVLDHHVFIAKAVFWEDGIPWTEDGHQLLKALTELQKRGYTSCEVVSYELRDGRMQESARTEHQGIVVPCQEIVPQGDTPEARRKDAARKLVQINSQYAKFNPSTSLFAELGFDRFELDDLVIASALDGLEQSVAAAMEAAAGANDPGDFESQMEAWDDEKLPVPDHGQVLRETRRHSHHQRQPDRYGCGARRPGPGD